MSFSLDTPSAASLKAEARLLREALPVITVQVDHRHAAATERLILSATGGIGLDIHFAIGDAVLGEQLARLGAVATPLRGVEHHLAAGVTRLGWV